MVTFLDYQFRLDLYTPEGTDRTIQRFDRAIALLYHKDLYICQ